MLRAARTAAVRSSGPARRACDHSAYCGEARPVRLGRSTISATSWASPTAQGVPGLLDEDRQHPGSERPGDGGSGFVLREAVGINDRGMVVATGHDVIGHDLGEGHDHESPTRFFLLERAP